MPSRMVINTESTVGYNNKLKRATTNLKLGVNSDVNADGTVEVGIKHNLGVSKGKLPHAVIKHESHNKSDEKKDAVRYTPAKFGTSKHELNLIAVMISSDRKSVV